MGFKRICHTCGKEYDYCPNCAAYEALPKWKTNWDTEECKDVWNIIIRYNTEGIPASEVQAVLDSYGVANYSKYNAQISTALEKILKKNDKKKSKNFKKNH
jgi:hypothetical protein